MVFLTAFLSCVLLCWPANLVAGENNECSWSAFVGLSNAQMKKHLVHFEPLQAPCCDRNLRLDGTISIRVAFNRKGEVVCAQAIDGHPLAVQAAMTSVRLWRFSPYRRKGILIDASGTVKVLYRLRSEESSSEVVGWSPRETTGNRGQTGRSPNSRQRNERPTQQTLGWTGGNG